MSRRKERFLKRQQARLKKQSKIIESINNFDNFASISSLYDAAIKASRGVKWKHSVQSFLVHILTNCAHLSHKLYNNEDVRNGFIEFDINERGKLRHIKAVNFMERVVQKSLCDNVLYPLYSSKVIYDNGASQYKKGTTFSIKRLKKHLIDYYSKFGNEGYILLIDFSSYFDNIDHDILKKLYRRYIYNENILHYLDLFVDAFGEKGLGLGSETSQMHSIYFINEIDHYIKEQLKIRYYGRYMDDSYIICQTKEELNEIMKKLKDKYDKYNIIVNFKKTIIKNLKHGFTYLKTRFYLTTTGKIITKPLRKSIVRQRRKMKKIISLWKEGIIDKVDLIASFESWAGSIRFKGGNRSIYSVRCLL